MNHNHINLVWLRRDLRLDDHTALSSALIQSSQVQIVFVFDTDILQEFNDPYDRRLTFIARTLLAIDLKLQERGGRLLIAYGRAVELIPQLASVLNAEAIFAAEDYEPNTIKRDKDIAKKVGPKNLNLVKDQVIFAPDEITRQGQAYKVYTPYAKIWRSALTPEIILPHALKDHGRYADYEYLAGLAQAKGIKIISCDYGVSAMLELIGYRAVDDSLWAPDQLQLKFTDFITNKSKNYDQKRNMLAEDGTSQLSPYLRFGLISIRQCVSAALRVNADVWLSELIWREFYASILYHYPESSTQEWNPKYRGRLVWEKNNVFLTAWKEGKTGYPLVDAAMRQLLIEGWMHNRARMISASFLTKHLLIDWREGEKHFAKYLMDYDLASNVGGWQWSASTGTDAQPYFRVFNPELQSRKFDPDGSYIRRYVPELKHIDSDLIHVPSKQPLLSLYYPQIVDHALAREKAITMFKSVGG